MNILDLGFKFETQIEFDGDDTGGIYTLKFKYIIATNINLGFANESFEIKQDDIDAIYEGVMKLEKALKPHITQGY